ncbi:phage portal protein [Telmatospirillum sp.]|uniref:phage portal protein n=1 Tax=Telmatospirillum sp. TaxID=2079197 RepID=UPI00284F380F|nr:phage portal protein [Telmatospirillum sp.]MDR3438960.1 phage portal protein [Telmatospirillum sp.]
MTSVSQFLDVSGRPMLPAAPASRPKPRANGYWPPTEIAPGAVFPYDAANWQTQEMGDWLPWIRSPDAEINIFRDRMVARTRDLARNDGWVAGAIGRVLDSTIGGEYRLSAKPDYDALSLVDKAFDADWADEFQVAAEALWRGFSANIGRYNDTSRQMTFTQQCRLALRHRVVDGESLVVSHWLPERISPMAAGYATSFLMVDPDRLSNPYQMVDTRYLRGGVEIDDHGVPLAYHIRKAHQNDWYNSIESMEWERVEREDPDGWLRVSHSFDHERAGQNRGVSLFAPIISRLKMLARFYGVTLQAATVSATFGTYVTSPYDPAMVEDALDGGDEELNSYQAIRSDWAEHRPALLNGVRVPTLAPGEKIESVSAERPNGEFSPFTHEMLRGLAAVLGISAEQVTNDYSEASWSSARAGIVEAEKTYERRCADFDSDTAMPMYATWLREALERDLLPLPSSVWATDPIEYLTPLARCEWLGAARGWVDPVAERQGAILGLDAGFSTLERECAKQGMDWRENIRQRARERKMFDELGLPPPEWSGKEVTATEASKKPEAE